MKNYDIVIVSHEKDFNNIKFIVEYSQKNLKFDSIHLILSERKEYNDLELIKSLTDKPIFLHLENDVLKVDKSKINHRPNWIYQMLLKIFQEVTSNDDFLIIESDCLILKEINFFNDGRTNLYLCRDQNHTPYFNFNNLLGFGREYDHSFISEFMMYNKQIVKDLLYKSNCNNVYDFLEIIYNNVNDNCYPADYELYGNFCFKFHRDKIDLKHLNYNFFGRESKYNPFWTDNEILNLIKSNSDKEVISFHTWGEN
jgi:hypothetical protein